MPRLGEQQARAARRDQILATAVTCFARARLFAASLHELMAHWHLEHGSFSWEAAATASPTPRRSIGPDRRTSNRDQHVVTEY